MQSWCDTEGNRPFVHSFYCNKCNLGVLFLVNTEKSVSQGKHGESSVIRET